MFSFIQKAFAQGARGPTLNNPLTATTIPDVLNSIANVLILFASPILAIMIIWGAFQYLTAAGNPEKAKSGSQTITYAVIGFIIILVSKGIAAIIRQILGTAA